MICIYMIQLNFLKRSLQQPSETEIITLLHENNEKGQEIATKSYGENEKKVKTWRELTKEWIERVPRIAQNLSPSAIPTQKRPFVFIHNAKSGGTSLRYVFHNASMEHKFNSWIPCMGGVPCDLFSFPPTEGEVKQVYASHLNYVHMQNMLQETSLGKVRKFDCLTNIRPTISRVESCWNWQIQMKHMPNLPSTANLSTEEWRTLMPPQCVNIFGRSFGNIGREFYNIAQDDPYYLPDLESILYRMSQCIIVQTDQCDDSNKVMRHFFPWVEVVDLCKTHQNVGKVRKSNEAVTEESKQAIMQFNYFDDLIFQFGQMLFKAQLDIAEKTILLNKTSS